MVEVLVSPREEEVAHPGVEVDLQSEKQGQGGKYQKKILLHTLFLLLSTLALTDHEHLSREFIGQGNL